MLPYSAATSSKLVAVSTLLNLPLVACLTFPVSIINKSKPRLVMDPLATPGASGGSITVRQPPSTGAGSNLTKEQLLEYVKKSKLKMKVLEKKLAASEESLAITEQQLSDNSKDMFHRSSEYAAALKVRDDQILALQAQIIAPGDDDDKNYNNNNNDKGKIGGELELVAAQEGMKRMEAELTEMRAAICTHQAEVLSIQSSAEAAKQEAAIHLGKLEEVHKLLAAQKIETQDSCGRYTVAQTELDALRRQLTASHKEKEDTSALQTAAKMEVDALRQELAVSREHVEKLRVECDKVRSDASTALQGKEEQLVTLRLERDSLEAAVHAAKKEEKASKRSEEMTLKMEVQTLRGQAVQWNAERERLEQEKRVVLEQLSASRKDADGARVAREELRRTCLSLEGQVENMQNEMALDADMKAAAADGAFAPIASAEAAEARVKKLLAEKSELEGERDALKQTLNARHEDSVLATKSQEQEHVEVNVLKDKCAAAEAAVVRLEAALESSEATSMQATAQATAAVAEMDSISKHIREVEGALSEARMSGSSLTDEVKQLTADAASTKTLLAAAQRRADELEGEVAAAQQSVRDSEAAAKGAAKRVASLEKEVQVAKDALSNAQMTTEAECDRLRTEMGGMSEKLSEQSKTMTSLRRDLDASSNAAQNASVAEAALKAKVEAFRASLKAAEDAADKAESDRVRAQEEAQELKEEITGLREASENEKKTLSRELDETRRLAAERAGALKQIKSEAEQSRRAEETVSGKAKKLKALLAKTKEQLDASERALSGARLQGGPPRSFVVRSRMLWPMDMILDREQLVLEGKGESSQGSHNSDEDNSSEYLLVERVNADGCAEEMPHWYLAAVVQEWRAAGATDETSKSESDGIPLIHTPWLEALRSLKSTLRDVTSSKERAKNAVVSTQAELADVMAQFSSYKTRAQSTLKKMSADDQTRRDTAKRLEEMQTELEEARVGLVWSDDKVRALEHEVSDVNSRLAKSQEALQSAASGREEEEQRATACEAAMGVMRTQLEEARAAARALEGTLSAAREETRVALERASTAEEEARIALALRVPPQTPVATTTMVGSDADDDDAARGMSPVVYAGTATDTPGTARTKEVRESDVDLLPSPAVSFSAPTTKPDLEVGSSDGAAQKEDENDEKKDKEGTSEFDAITMGGLTTPLKMLAQKRSQQNANYLVQKRDKEALDEAHKALRREFSEQQAELSDLQSTFALMQGQTNLLKETIRDLEGALAREREFSSHSGDGSDQDGRSIKTDYLVNVLKTFLSLSGPEAAAERARLAPVLCQILHLTPDESTIIKSAWQDSGNGLRARLGTLVGGWLQQAPVVESKDAGADAGAETGTKFGSNSTVASGSAIIGGNENPILPFS